MGKLIAIVLSLCTTIMGSFNICYDGNVRIPTVKEVIESGFEQESVGITIENKNVEKEYTKEKYGRFARDMEMNYYRGQLDKVSQSIYDKVLLNLVDFKDMYINFREADFTEKQFDKAVEAVFGDYPEIGMYTSIDYMFNEETGEAYNCRIECKYKWREWGYFSAGQMKMVLNTIDLICDSIIARMPDGTNAEKYEYLARKIAKMTQWKGYRDRKFAFNSDWSFYYLNGIFLKGNGEGVAYASAYQYLCHRAGLWNITISNGDHEWNMVKLEDGSTYHVDVACADRDDGFDSWYLFMTQEDLEGDYYVYEGMLKATGKSFK